MKEMSKRLQCNYCNEQFLVYHRDVNRRGKAVFPKTMHTVGKRKESFQKQDNSAETEQCPFLMFCYKQAEFPPDHG